MRKELKSSRRSALKAIGATLGGSLIAGQVSAGRSYDEIFNQGLKIKNKTGNRELFEKYITNRGFEISQQNSETFPYVEPTEGPDIQHAEPDDMTLLASVYTGGDNSTYASADWWVTRDLSDAWNDFDDTGHPPKDAIGIGWEHSDYDINWGSWNSDDFTSKHIATTEYVAFKHSDENSHHANAGDGDGIHHQGWASVKMTPTAPVENRKIIVTYQHTWVGGSISGFSFDASGGMSIGVSLETKKWSSPRQVASNDA